MKRLFIIACIATLILIGFTSQPAYAAGESIYIVQPGDTLFTIAARYNISVNDLAAANGLNGGFGIYAGQQLIIPAFSPFSEPPLFAGAANQLGGPQAVGFTPLPTPPPSTGVYTIRPGDTLSSVANRYGVTLADLQAANSLTDFSLPIYSGQQLVMPMGAIDSSPGSILTPPAPPIGPSRAGLIPIFPPTLDCLLDPIAEFLWGSPARSAVCHLSYPTHASSSPPPTRREVDRC